MIGLALMLGLAGHAARPSAPSVVSVVDTPSARRVLSGGSAVLTVERARAQSNQMVVRVYLGKSGAGCGSDEAGYVGEFVLGHTPDEPADFVFDAGPALSRLRALGRVSPGAMPSATLVLAPLGKNPLDPTSCLRFARVKLSAD